MFTPTNIWWLNQYLTTHMIEKYMIKVFEINLNCLLEEIPLSPTSSVLKYILCLYNSNFLSIVRRLLKFLNDLPLDTKKKKKIRNIQAHRFKKETRYF